jgi:outer membrane protein insertion porin family
MRFPLGLPNEIGMHGVAFVDLATLYDIDVPDGVDTTKTPYFDSKNLRGAYGLGVVWSSPVGLLSFNYGIPFAKEKFDIVQRFNFSIGKSF